MAKKLKLIRSMKDVKKNVVPALTTTAAEAASFLGTKGGTTLLMNTLEKKAKDAEKFAKIKKVAGPVQFGLGFAVKLFANDPHVQAVGSGMCMAGVSTMADDFIPDDVKTKIGLSGLGATKVLDGSFQRDLDAEFQKMADEASAEVEEDLEGYKERAFEKENLRGDDVASELENQI